MRSLIVTLVALAAAAGVACSQSGPDPTATPVATATSELQPSATPTPSPPIALKMLQESNQRMRDVVSYRATVKSEIRTLGEGITLSSEVDRSRDGKTHSFSIVERQDGSESSEIILDQPDVYFNIGGAGWVRTTADELVRLTGQNMDVFDIDPFGNIFPEEDIPWDLYTVEYLGRDVVDVLASDGVATDHLGIKLDIQQVMQALNADEMRRFLSSSVIGAAPQDVLRQMRVTGVEVWIDDQGYTRRYKQEALGGTVFTTTEVRMFEFNEEIAIEAPQDYETREPEAQAAATQREAAQFEVDLSSMVLTNEDVGKEFPELEISDGSGPQDAVEAARGTVDPDDTGQDVESSGRIDGFLNILFDEMVFSGAVRSPDRPAAFSSSADLYDTEESAANAVTRELSDYQRLTGRQLEGVFLAAFQEFDAPDLGQSAFAGRAVVTGAFEEPFAIDLIMWHRDRVVAIVSMISLSSEEDAGRSAVLERLAQAMDRRVQATLAE